MIANEYANNDWCKIIGLEIEDKGGELMVLVRIENTREIKFTLKDFYETFIPGFCITVYAAQGTTIDRQFAIADYAKMPWRLAYTSISRACEFAQISEFVL